MKQFAVFGLGSFGCSLATSLYELGYDVYAIDRSEEVIHAIADRVTYAVQADVSDIHALKSIGIQNMDVVIVALASDLNASLMAVINAKELGVKTVLAKAKDDVHSKVLYKLGVDKVILPEIEMGGRTAHALANGFFMDLIALDPTHTIAEAEAPEKWWKKSLMELNLRAKYNINVLVIKRGEEVIVNPAAEEEILEGDHLIVIGETSIISKFAQQRKRG